MGQDVPALGKQIWPSNETLAIEAEHPLRDVFPSPRSADNGGIGFPGVWIELAVGKESTSRERQTTEGSQDAKNVSFFIIIFQFQSRILNQFFHYTVSCAIFLSSTNLELSVSTFSSRTHYANASHTLGLSVQMCTATD